MWFSMLCMARTAKTDKSKKFLTRILYHSPVRTHLLRVSQYTNRSQKNGREQLASKPQSHLWSRKKIPLLKKPKKFSGQFPGRSSSNRPAAVRLLDCTKQI